MLKPKRYELGMHSYTLHLRGLGESWGTEKGYEFERTMTLIELMDLAVETGLDGLHITNVDLETLDDENLKNVKEEAEKRNLWLEYNVSFDAPSDPRVNSTVADAIENGYKMGAKCVKFSLDIERPKPRLGSKFHPDVMRQLATRYDEFKAALPLLDKYPELELSIENHTDTYCAEVVWLIEKLQHPKIGACYDNKNCLCMGERPEDGLEVMAPYVNCVHLADNNIVIDENGTHSIGTSLGEGDLDLIHIIKTFNERSPHLQRIVLEVEAEIGDVSIEEAREKEMEAYMKSVDYCYDVLGIGKRRLEENK